MGHDRDSLDPTGIADGFTEPLPYEPSEDDRKLVTRVKELFNKAKRAKGTYDRDMDFWRRYLRGEQHFLFRDKDSGDVVRLVPRDAKRLYSQNNQLRPTMRSLVGKMTRMTPTFVVVPPTMDQDEVHGARVADAFFAFARQKEKLDVKYIEWCEDAASFGTGVLQLEWDPTAGQCLAYCTECEGAFPEEAAGEDCPNCTGILSEAASMNMEASMMEAQATGGQPEALEANKALTAPIPKLDKAYEGDFRVRVRDPRNVFPEAGVSDPLELRYCFYRESTPVTEVRRRFPEMGIYLHAEVGPDDAASDLRQSEVTDEHVQLYEYHERPTELYPKGRIVWIANDLVLKEIESPYAKLGRLPFYWARWTVNKGEIWGESFLAQAWHRQKELNALETVQREYSELMARPRYLKPIGSKIAQDEISALTAQLIAYNANAGKIEPLQIPELPQGFFARRQELIDDIRGQAGVTAQEAGLQTSDPNGRAMAIIEAEADQQLGPITRRNNTEWGELHRGILVLVDENYSRTRSFTVSGEDTYTETFSFEEMNLSPGWDIQLEVEDGLSKNQALRMTQAMELLQGGVFTDPQTGVPDVRKFVRVARLKIPGIGPDMNSTEYAAARDLIRKIENQEVAEPGPEDDAVAFEEVIRHWLRANRRRKPPELIDQVRQAWQFYAMWAASGAPPLGFMGGGQEGSQPGQDQSAPGGTPNNAGKLGTNLSPGAPGLAQEAQQGVQNADAAAEGQARTTQQREG